MKSLAIASLIGLLSLNASADCLNAYKEKAAKRAHSNMVLKNTAAWGALVGGTAAAGALLGPNVFVLTGVGGGLIGTLATADSNAGPLKFFGESGNNTFHKVIDAIEAARENKLSPELLRKLDKKIKIKSYSNAEQARMEMIIANYIKGEDMSKRLCSDGDKLRTITFGKLVRKIVDEVQF